MAATGYANVGDNMTDGEMGKIVTGPRDHRVLNGGGLVLPALHGRRR